MELIKSAYLPFGFAREIPTSEVPKLRQRLEEEQSRRFLQETRLERLEKELESTKQLLKKMLEERKSEQKAVRTRMHKYI